MPTLGVRYIYRRDEAANWSSINPVLRLGEPGYETDTNKLKVGDGVTPWNDLDYIIGDEGPPGPPGPSANQGINPIFTYTGEQLTQIDYDSGLFKTLSYDGSLLDVVVFFNGTTTITKQLNYTDGKLTSITQTEV